MKAILACILLTALLEGIVAPPARNKETTTTTTTEDPHVDRMPEPEYWLYLSEVARILTANGFMKTPEAEKAVGDIDHMRSKEARKAMLAALNRMTRRVMDELTYVKRKEIDRLRRKIIPRKKNVEYKDDVGSDHLKMGVTSFGIDDLYALLDANLAHNEKYEKMRKEDFKRYEMEKRFRAEQKARHIKNEEKRKEFLEQREKERAEYNAAKKKEKAPLTKEEVKEIWKEKDELPEDEFNPKTFFAIHDLDSNGLLDLDEIRMLVANEINRTFEGTPADHRERVEEMEKLRAHIYKNMDKNKDLMIDFDEFLEQIERENEEEKARNDAKKNGTNDYDDWKDAEDQRDVEYNDEEFEKFEKEEIDHIREEFGQGKKPDGYDYEDVPLLDGNFINETHVKVGNEIYKANDAPRDQRREAFKRYEMEKKFEMEQKIQDMNNLPDSEKQKLQHDLDTLYYNGSNGLNPIDNETPLNKPLSPEQLETVWEEQDHKTKEQWNPTTFFHLHDINQDSFIDVMELRLMLVTELKKNKKEFDAVEKEEELERMKDNIMEEADKNKDGKLDLNEFLEQVELTAKRNEERRKKEERESELENQRYWKTLDEETQFTAEEYSAFREQKTLEIRKMIANGMIPENYNYSHVPLLQGNFINSSHIQRGPDLFDIHEQEDAQRNADFKLFKMAERFAFEDRLSKMNPEERAIEEERVRKHREEWKKRMAELDDPLSEHEVKEVWKEEDKMEEEPYSEEKFFRLHDVNEDGHWDNQEVRQILLRELAKLYENNTEVTEKEKVEQLERWRGDVFDRADTNKDGYISQQEFSDFQKWKQAETEKEAKQKKEAASTDYPEEEYEKFKAKKLEHPT